MFKGSIRRWLSRLGATFNQALISETRAQQKQLLARLKETEDRITTAVREATARAERVAAKHQQAIDAALRDLTRQQVEIRLMMKRLDQSGDRRAEGGPRIPVTASELPPEPDARSAAASPVPADSIVELTVCAVCGSGAYTQVCEYNKLLLLDSDVDAEAKVYDYSLCHDCGVVFARRRPVGPRYAYLLERFELTLGRVQDGISAPGNRALSSGALTDDDRRALSERAAKGVFVSEHLGMRQRDYVPALLKDRMSSSVHIELIGSLLPLNKPRVLELRPRLGSIGAALTRLYGAQVYGMPLFDGQQFLIRETYGIPVDHKVDYDQFSVPYEGQFDLVIANHMFTHSLRPREFFETIRRRLAPGGHVYLYNEPDERDFLDDGKSMINSLNAFHMQTFDGSSLARALGACGFEPVFITHHFGNLIALAKAAPDVRWTRMPADERQRRITAYRNARDRAILKLPDHLRWRFAGEWDAVVERTVASGRANFDDRGKLRLAKTRRDEAE
jgi:SAM-dependent methyltransferase